MNLGALKFAAMLGIVFATLAGLAFGDSRTRPAPFVSHEDAHAAALVVEAVPGAMRLLEPYVAPAETKPLEEADVEAEVPEEELGGDLTREDRRIVSALGELEALIQSVQAERRTLSARELNGYLANCISGVREAGGTVEELDELLDKLFAAVKAPRFSEAEASWLRTEANVQRDRFLVAKR